MTIDELRAVALAAAIDENETTGWYLRWDAGVAAFRWEVAFTAVEERPEWAGGSWATVGEAVKAAGPVCSWVASTVLYTKKLTCWIYDWDGQSNIVTASWYREPPFTVPIGEIETLLREDLSEYFETGDDEEGEE